MSFTQTLRAAQDGDPDALGDLWRALNPRLVRFLRARAGDAADDLASETWIRAARTLHRFTGDEGDFRAWLFTIARRTAVDSARFEARRPSVPDDGSAFGGVAADDDPAERAITAIDAEHALAVVRRLPADQADVVLMRVVAGLDVRRVAEILGKTDGAVRVLQHRALRRLATLLTPLDEPRDVTR